MLTNLDCSASCNGVEKTIGRVVSAGPRVGESAQEHCVLVAWLCFAGGQNHALMGADRAFLGGFLSQN